MNAQPQPWGTTVLARPTTPEPPTPNLPDIPVLKMKDRK